MAFGKSWPFRPAQFGISVKFDRVDHFSAFLAFAMAAGVFFLFIMSVAVCGHMAGSMVATARVDFFVDRAGNRSAG